MREQAKPATARRSARPAKKKPQTRAERSERTRDALFRAAAEVVGEVGYADASIAKITERAEVAQGTFYNYFESRQDLFDQLLPTLGQEMLEYIKERLDPDATGAEREIQRIKAYFQYLEEFPEFYRILYEAETLAPKAHHKHMEVIAGGYTRSLQRSWAKGEMPGFDKRELEIIAYVLLAARGYIGMRYREDGNGIRIPKWVVNTYAKLIRQGLFAGEENGEG